RAWPHTPLTGVLLFLRPIRGGAARLQQPDITHQRRRLRTTLDRLRRRGFRWRADADQDLARLAAEHCFTDDRGAMGSAVMPAIFHSTAAARDDVPPCGRSIPAALSA